MVSHYAWRDDNSLLVWARAPEHGDRYYVVDATTGRRDVYGAGTLDRFGDGHPSFSPDGRWIVTDSYPDRARMRHLLLCRHEAGEVIEVGAFHSPWRYDGAVRCDLHPRWSPDGRSVSIDSAHEGVRRTYAVDVSRLVRSKRA
jgi:Tol biopolymer transport system component